MRPAHVAAVLAREFETASEGLHTPVMLWGPPGVGKSDIVRDLAAAAGVGLVDLRLSQLEPTDLRGIPFREGRVVEWSVPTMLPEATRHGERGILFLDEINAAAPTVAAAAYQLILDRRLGDYAVPPAWVIFAAGNRQGDRGVTYAMPAPLANRFTHYELEPDIDDWVAWAHSAGVDARVIAFLRFRPERLFDFDPSRTPIAFPSPRTWEYAHRAIAKFGERPDLLLEGLQACVGQVAGAELKAFMDHMARLPDVDAILRGEAQPMPETVDLQYGVASALVRRITRALRPHEQRDACVRVLDYARRFPQREMGVMLVADLQRAIGRPLIDVPQFGEWAESLGELVVPERGRT
ncbi:MAG: AAA domain-containing protein [Betaproteobacteria bacterium]|nr:AAA domain-containing protein [Betaproteobacteria bacterium]